MSIGSKLKGLGNKLKPQNPKDLIADAEKKAKQLKQDALDKLEKAKRDAQNKADAVTDKIKDAISKIKVAKGDMPYLTLIPFKPVMVKMLDARKIQHNNQLSDIAPKFIANVVNKTYGKTPITNVLSGASLVQHSTFMQKVGHFNAEGDGEAQYTEEGSTASQYEAGAKETKGMIQKIIAWFKERKAKKEAKKLAEQQAEASGQPMPDNYGDLSTPPITSEESDAIDKADAIARDIVSGAEKDVDADDTFSPIQIILGLGGIVVAIVIIKKVFF